MPMLISILLFVFGLILMVFGAEVLVRGASRLAVMMGISPLVVGLTVVAFGTSAPEFAVSINAAIANQTSLCVGNVVGSNIFNVLFILGVSSLIVPLIVARQLIRFDLPLVIAVSLLTLVLSLDGSFNRTEGAIFFAGLVAYTCGLVYYSRKQGKAVAVNEVDALIAEPSGRSLTFRLVSNLSFIIVGLVMLVLGANWLVETAVQFARWLQVSELIIGLTIVSIGTSLPEVVTSVVASLKGERDIAVGNVIGSNLFNLLGVLGIAAIVAPAGLAISPDVLQIDLPMMIAAVIIALPVFYSGGVITRWEGIALLTIYIAYMIYLVLSATSHPQLELFRNAVVYVFIPLTLIWLGVTSYQAFAVGR
jgi:cation:H+ antiporter